MDDLIIDCSTHNVITVKKTPEQEAERLAEIEVVELDIAVQDVINQKKKDAIERLKKSTNKDIIDLLEACRLV